VVNFAFSRKADLQVATDLTKNEGFSSRLLAEQHFHRFDIGFGHALRAVVVSHLRLGGSLGLQMRQTDFAPLEFAGSRGGNPFGSGFMRLHLVAHNGFSSQGFNFSGLKELAQENGKGGLKPQPANTLSAKAVIFAGCGFRPPLNPQKRPNFSIRALFSNEI